VTATWQIAVACGGVAAAVALAVVGWNHAAAIILIVGVGIGVVVTDSSERRIPRTLIRIGAVGAIACMVVAWIRSKDLELIANALISAALVGLAFVAVYLWRPEAIGFGDVRLATLLAAITAWGANDPNAAVVAVIGASAVGLVVMLTTSRRSLPFAPCLIPASVAAVAILGLA
jgi:leader peptidase (prepilin peptidase)/N-methyltransferase